MNQIIIYIDFSIIIYKLLLLYLTENIKFLQIVAIEAHQKNAKEKIFRYNHGIGDLFRT